MTDDPETAAQDLLVHGYVVLSTRFDQHPDLCSSILADIEKERSNLPGFCEGAHTQSGGSFGARDDPGSFLNPAVERLRRLAYRDTLRVFEAVLKLEQFGFNQVLFDRDMVGVPRKILRQWKTAGLFAPGERGGEAMHRDLPEKGVLSAGVRTQGGFVALTRGQAFRCIPNTHTDPIPEGKFGFYKVGEAEGYDSKNLVRVLVPRGCMLVFFEEIVHAVAALPTDLTEVAQRLFTAYRQTRDETIPTLPGSTREMIDAVYELGETPVIKSGQCGAKCARFTPKLYSVNHPRLNDAFARQCLDPDLWCPGKEGLVKPVFPIPSLHEMATSEKYRGLRERRIERGLDSAMYKSYHSTHTLKARRAIMHPHRPKDHHRKAK
jgi:hypothetical protein